MSSPSTTAPLDMEVIAMLRDLADDEDFLAELLDAYIASSCESVAAIERGLETDDATAIKSAAHSLKGASGNVGASVVQTLCQSIEADAETMESGQLKSLAQQLREEFDRVRIEIDRVLSRPPGAS